MLSSLRRTCGTFAAKFTEALVRCLCRQRPGLEALEGRQLLSLGNEFLVNTTTRNTQYHSDSASAANSGLSVVVWEDEFNSTDHDIRAQMYNADGSKRGPEIVVDFDGDMASHPAAAMDAAGDWVVTWEKDSPTVQSDVWAQRYSSSGAKLGSRIDVSDDFFYNDSDPDVAMDNAGNFVISYTLELSSSNEDVVAQLRDSSSGDLLEFYQFGDVDVRETKSSVAMNPNGNEFAIAYQSHVNGSAEEDVHLRWYTTAGSQLGYYYIAHTSARELNPSVAMDNAGNAVVAYQKLVGNDYDIKARRVSRTGIQGDEINIRNTFAQEVSPTVALSRTGGAFVVAYNSDLLSIPGNRTVEVAEVTAANQVVAIHNLPGFPNNGDAALSIDADGDFLLSYTGGIGSGSDANIFARRGHLLG